MKRSLSRSPSPHLHLGPLARGLLLAMAALPAAVVQARDLDRESATVVAGDPVEAWRLVDHSLLIVTGGQTLEINASDNSELSLWDAVVTRSSGQHAITLDDSHMGLVRGKVFGGVALQGGRTRAIIGESAISVTSAGLAPGASASVGMDLLATAGSSGTVGPQATLHASSIHVEDAPAPIRDISNGVGVRMHAGQMDIVSGSRVIASNIGVVLWGQPTPDEYIRLTLDDSIIQSGRGAALRVNADADTTYDITVANGAQLLGGDGNLLLVGRDSGVATGRTDVNFTVDDARLAGNVTLDPAQAPTAQVKVVLRNQAQIDGRFFNITTASIDGDSTWLMTGDSNVGQLNLGATGTIGLGDGSSFNTLTVDAFTGNGGTLLFNTVLGDDTSLTDTLVINGDANGQANVRVLNAGGAGAETDRGIELIDIAGASNAQFDLVGRAVGGQYEYFLVKDANGNWYLRSELTTTPDPCNIDPTLPDCTPITPIDPVDPNPVPVLRPEAGAYLANQFALDQMLRHTWRDRQGGVAAAEGIRGWAHVDATQSRLWAAEDQLDLRVHRSRLQLGADIGVLDEGRGRVGVMGTLAQSSATSRSELTGYSAKGNVEGGALGVYGNWASNALYVDASVQRGQFRNRVQGEGLAEERYDSAVWQSSLEAGYRFGIGQIGSTVLSLQPELQLIHTAGRTGVHTESNGTVVRASGNSGLSGRAGLRLQGEGHSAAGASVSPYVAANVYRDGAGNGIAFDDDVLKAGTPRNRYELSAGARLEFRAGFSAWGGLGVTRGDHGYREATGKLSVAYRW